MTLAWNLDEVQPQIFPHAPNGTCVVHLEASSNPTKLSDGNILIYAGSFENPSIILDKSQSRPKASVYLDRIKRGAMSQIHGLFVVESTDIENIENRLVRISTKMSKKGAWKNVSFEDIEIESQSLLPLATARALNPYSISIERYIIDVRRTDLPLLSAYYKKANVVFQSRKPPTAADSLEDQFDWRRLLSRQEEQRRQESVKVFLNKSGGSNARYRAARGSTDWIAEDKLYYIIAQNISEALYLVGVVNADCMQAAWRRSKTSSLDFDLNPWRSVPVPLYDQKNQNHRAIVSAVKETEREPENRSLIESVDRAVFELKLT